MNLFTSMNALCDRPWLRVPASVAAVTLSYGSRVLLGPADEGRQLADAARTLRPDIKIVYTTGYARDGEV